MQRDTWTSRNSHNVSSVWTECQSLTDLMERYCQVPHSWTKSNQQDFNKVVLMFTRVNYRILELDLLLYTELIKGGVSEWFERFLPGFLSTWANTIYEKSYKESIHYLSVIYVFLSSISFLAFSQSLICQKFNYFCTTPKVQWYSISLKISIIK